MGSRLEHIDVAKGIGIILVVLGHNWIIRTEKGELFRIIFSFHMPLFFFLSGVLFNPQSDFRRLWVGKTGALLKPYFATLAAVGIYRVLVKHDDPVTYTLGVLYGTGVSIPWGWVSLWFLAHLWCVFIFAGLLHRLWPYEKTNPAGKTALLAVLLVSGYMSMRSFWNIPLVAMGYSVSFEGTPLVLHGLPFGIDLLGISSFYFLLGTLTKRFVRHFTQNPVLTLLAVLSFAACHFFYDDTIDMNLRVYDDLVVSTAEAVSGIYLVLVLSDVLARRPMPGRVLAYVGAGSLFLLIFHDYAQDRVLTLLQARRLGDDYSRAMISLASGLLVPLILFEVTRRTPMIAFFLLPRSPKRPIQPVQPVRADGTPDSSVGGVMVRGHGADESRR